MLLEGLIGAAGGGILRLAPEVLKLLDRRNERAHELALGQQQQEMARLQQAGQQYVADRQADQAQVVAALEALRDGIKAQATSTGNWFFDGLNTLVRPAVTYLVTGMWAAVKVAAFVAAQATGSAWYDAVLGIWGANDVAMLTGILNFWFLGRVFDKRA